MTLVERLIVISKSLRGREARVQQGGGRGSWSDPVLRRLGAKILVRASARLHNGRGAISGRRNEEVLDGSE